MPRRFADRARDPELASWADVPGLTWAFGIVLLLGLVSGVIWIAWNLIRIHLFHAVP